MEKEYKELYAKIDKIFEIQELILKRLDDGVVLFKNNHNPSPSSTRKLTKREEQQMKTERLMEDIRLSLEYGHQLQRQFNLAVQPHINRIRAYLETKNPSVFDGLKRDN
ncbi:hypothetical protein [Chryseobacterium nematophagum]|uniref:hypothetical protein n=1 Tax=Chryseobacterium nematophagum TaxID=2305228 RepID=UPI0016052029|nr:hypothetical protein [Chryseobacterium nematophagum]